MLSQELFVGGRKPPTTHQLELESANIYTFFCDFVGLNMQLESKSRL